MPELLLDGSDHFLEHAKTGQAKIENHVDDHRLTRVVKRREIRKRFCLFHRGIEVVLKQGFRFLLADAVILQVAAITDGEFLIAAAIGFQPQPFVFF